MTRRERLTTKLEKRAELDTRSALNEKAEQILDGLAANGFDVRGRMRVERPEDRTSPPFGPASAAHVHSTTDMHWRCSGCGEYIDPGSIDGDTHSVAGPDGGLAGYCGPVSLEAASAAHVHSFAVDTCCECGVMLSAYVKGLGRQLGELTALREADQATIATLGLVNKSLADALEAVRPFVLKRFEKIEEEAQQSSSRSAWKAVIDRAVKSINLMDAALRAAGRLS